MYRVALVEDEELIRTMIRLNLEKAGFQVDCFTQAEELLEILDQISWDVFLLDIMLPAMSGEELVAQIRGKNINTPILMVTAKSDLQTKISSFGQGADDYLPKPFHMEELLARVNALIRRSQGDRTVPSDSILKIGAYTVNLESRESQTKKGLVLLTEKESDLLKLFASSPGQILTRADILDEVWGMDADPTPRTVDNFILRFRKWFEERPEEPRHFITIHATGYRFEP